MVDDAVPAPKLHHKRKAGKNASKKEAKKRKGLGDNKSADAKHNPKAFIYSSAGKSQRQRMRTAEKVQRRMHVPVMEKPVEEPPPFVVLVQGPPGVGKTLLIRCLVKHFSKQVVTDIRGPVTVVSNKTRRLTFVDCPKDLNSMIDAAKYADLVLLLIDGSFGFEMETFEFLNLLQVHGFPKVMGVLTHLDGFRDNKAQKVAKKTLKHRFWAEIYQGAKLFYLSGIKNGRYLNREILNLARFISVMKFRPLSWRQSHPYLLVDRLEEMTPVDDIRLNPKCDRSVALYGYVRGANWRSQQKVHIAGLGDHVLGETEALPDPCPSPSVIKKRTLNEKERLLYAPMSDVGALSYDKDGMYIEIPDWKLQYTGRVPRGQGAVDGAPEGAAEGEAMVMQLQGTRVGVDQKLEAAEIQLFADGPIMKGNVPLQDKLNGGASHGIETVTETRDGQKRVRRRVMFDNALPVKSAEATDSTDDGAGADGYHRMPSSMQHTSQDHAVGVAEGSEDDGCVSTDADGETDRDYEAVQEISDGEAGNGVYVTGHAHRDKAAGFDDRRLACDAVDEGDGDDDSEGLGHAAKWKSDLVGRAADAFFGRGVSLQQLVYGDASAYAGGPVDTDRVKDSNGAAPSGEMLSDDDEELFKPKSADGRTGNGAAELDAFDSAVLTYDQEALRQWYSSDTRQLLKNRFVTGDWNEGRKRSQARPLADGDEGDASDSEEEVYGDFEDVEAGVSYRGMDDVTVAVTHAIESVAAQEEADRLKAKKLAQKAAFDQQYDTGDPAADGEDLVLDRGHQGPPQGPGQEETYYDAKKRDMAERALQTRAALDELDPAARIAMEGHRPGTYVRLLFHGVPCELLQHFDPHVPILVGGLLPGEERLGLMQLRIKRHRWFPKILKNRDPLIFSVGWRRFQSVPVYSIEDRNGRERMLKYSPEHMHCTATVYGPVVPPNTGVVAVQNLADKQVGWRIAATGVITNVDASARIMKKLKLVGTPYKIHKNTAFVKGMFTTQLEAAKFEGASVRTVSGIRGSIKRALRAGTHGGPDGSVRVTMEDKTLMSDILFLRAWVQVDTPKLYNPVTNLLMPLDAPGRSTRILQRKGDRNTSSDVNAATENPSHGALQGTASAGSGPSFVAAPQFLGPRPGFVFKSGLEGLGYYADEAVSAAAAATADLPGLGHVAGLNGTGASNLSGADEVNLSAEQQGWIAMKTVAQLRRERGEGAPRNSDSLYRPIVRVPKRFSALKIPKNLQQQLPFKTKPKLMLPRARKTLEQKRAVVLEPDEKRKVTLLQQLATIQHKKIAARKAQHARQATERAKKLAVEEAWRKTYNKQERTKRYRDQAMQEKQQKNSKH